MNPEQTPQPGDADQFSDAAIDNLAAKGEQYLPSDHSIGNRPEINEIRAKVCEALIPRWMERHQRPAVISTVVKINCEAIEGFLDQLASLRSVIGQLDDSMQPDSEQEEDMHEMLKDILEELDDPAQRWKNADGPQAESENTIRDGFAELQSQIMEMMQNPKAFIRKLVEQHRAGLVSPSAIAMRASRDAHGELLTREVFIANQRKNIEEISASLFTHVFDQLNDDPELKKAQEIMSDFTKELASTAANRRCLVTSERILSRLTMTALSVGMEAASSPESLREAIRQELPRRADYIEYIDEMNQSMIDAAKGIKNVVAKVKEIFASTNSDIPVNASNLMSHAIDSLGDIGARVAQLRYQLYSGFRAEDAHWIYDSEK